MLICKQALSSFLINIKYTYAIFTYKQIKKLAIPPQNQFLRQRMNPG